MPPPRSTNRAVTADSGHLYAVSAQGSAVSHFTIGLSGNLRFAGCIGDLAGCTVTSPLRALDGADGVAVSNDGAHLYTTSFPGNVVTHLTIAGFLSGR